MQLTSDQLRHFEREGWLIVEDVFDVERDFEPLLSDFDRLTDEIAGALQAAGKLRAYEPRESFPVKVRRITEQVGSFDVQPFDISLPQFGVREDTPMYLGPGAFDILRKPLLLDLVEQFVGGEIYSNPVQHIRFKVPERLVPDDAHHMLGRSSPWHQDSGVVTEDADSTEMLTVWVPLTDATEDRGCLAVVAGSHRQGLRPHCPQPYGLTIPAREIPPDRVVPLPMRAGSVLFLTRYTMHCSLPNLSDETRWSFDLRYQPVGQPTGRAAFPGFVARSRRRPESELRDAEEWARRWIEARARLAGKPAPVYNRWASDAPWCA